MLHKKLIIDTLILFLIFFSFSPKLIAQNIDYEKLSLDELDEVFGNIEDNTTGQKVAKIYIKKAKKENNLKALFYAYRYITFYTQYPINLKYSDSVTITAKKINNLEFIANAYINKSEIFNIESMYKKSIDNLLIANYYAKKNNDEYLKNKTLYGISTQEIYLGNYYEAHLILNKINKFYKKNIDKKELGKDYDLYYFYSVVSLIDLNTKIGKQSENIPLYIDAYKILKLDKNYKVYEAYLVSCEGVDAYYNKNYPLAIAKLNEAIKKYKDQWFHVSEIYYLGLIYWKLNQKEKAIKYFLKLDKEYYKNKNQDPKFRPAYELLIQYYKSKKDKEKQLEYIDKLMALDHYYEKNYKYIFSKINKEYTTEKLIQEKKDIENALKFHKILIIFIIILSFSIGSLIFYRYTKIQRTYKQRFREILAEKNKISILENNLLLNQKHSSDFEDKKTLLISKIPGLNASTIDGILSKLENFEKENRFLNNQITQKYLSEEFGTNPSYLSKIINIYKEKKFSQYISDLRLDYIIDKLKSDEYLLKKDVKEIAHIAGFASAESFSDNFQRKFKIKPSYFIKMMKENINSYDT